MNIAIIMCTILGAILTTHQVQARTNRKLVPIAKNENTGER